CAALDLPGVECCRGYIQSWWGAGNPIPERSAQRILKAADQILKAGTTTTSDAEMRSRARWHSSGSCLRSSRRCCLKSNLDVGGRAVPDEGRHLRSGVDRRPAT